MDKIFLGFEDIQITTIDDVDYVKLADVEKLARYAYGNYLACKFRYAMDNVKFVCDSNKGIVFVENADEVENGTRNH